MARNRSTSTSTLPSTVSGSERKKLNGMNARMSPPQPISEWPGARTLARADGLLEHGGDGDREQHAQRHDPQRGCAARGTGRGRGTRARRRRSAAAARSRRTRRAGRAGSAPRAGRRTRARAPNSSQQREHAASRGAAEPGLDEPPAEHEREREREEAPRLVEVRVQDRCAAPRGRARPAPSPRSRSPAGAPNTSRATRKMPSAASASSAAASGASTCQVASPESEETAAKA